MRRRSVGTNVVALSSGEVGNRFMYAALAVVVARVLGTSNFGRFVFASSLAGILQVVSDFGLGLYVVRTLSKEPRARQELLPSIVSLRLLTTILGGAIAIAYAVTTIHDSTLLAATVLAVGYVLLGVYAEFVFTLYRVEEAMVYEAMGKLGTAVAYAGGGIVLVATGHGVVTVLAWSCLVAIGLDAYAWWISRRLHGFRIRLGHDGAKLRAALIASLPFGVLAVLTSISFRIDSLMIELIRGTGAVGLYGAAYRTMESTLLVPGIFAVALLPVLARSIESDVATVLGLVNNAIRLLWSIAFPLAVGLAFLGGTVLGDIFGGTYHRAHVVLALLGFTLLPLFASAITSSVIAAGRRPQLNTAIAAGMVVLNVALNLVLIPAIGINGAGVATLATEGAGLVAGGIFIARVHGAIAWHRFALKPLVAAGAMSGVIVLCHSSLVGIPLYAAVYVAIILLLRGVTKDDIALVRDAVLPQRAA